jgi:hypothetical protein
VRTKRASSSKQEDSMGQTRGITCELTAFHIDNPPGDDVTGKQEWMAIATAHVYNPSPNTGGILTPETAILAGAVMEVIYGKSMASTQEGALVAALRALLFQLRAKGYSV